MQVEHEDIQALKSWGLRLDTLLESCVLCGAATRTWHRPSNQPVCANCAETRDANDLPTKKSAVPAQESA